MRTKVLREELRWERANIWGLRASNELDELRALIDEATMLSVVDAEFIDEMVLFVQYSMESLFTLHVLVQPSESTSFKSSHSSSPAITPSPHLVKHFPSEQTQPSSILQFLEHPSPSISF